MMLTRHLWNYSSIFLIYNYSPSSFFFIQRFSDEIKCLYSLESGDAEPIQPGPPLIFKHKGDSYILHTSASVRQSFETIGANTRTESSPNGVMIESVLDLESNHRSNSCQV